MRAVLPAATVAGATLVALATLLGARLPRRGAGRRAATWAGVGVLLVAVVLGALLPDVRADLAESGVAWWAAGLAGATGFAGTGLLVRRGCTCEPAPDAPAQVAGGTVAAVAVAVHRGLEGAALALAGSAAVVTALAVHAAGEGFALGALLSRASRARRAGLLLVACLSPLAGALAAERLPAAVVPVVTAAVAGALLRGGWLALRVAVRRRPARAAVRDPQPA